MALGIHLDNIDSLHDPVPSLIVSLIIDVELGKEVLDITLIIGGQKAIIEVLSEGQHIGAVSVDWRLSDSSAT